LSGLGNGAGIDVAQQWPEPFRPRPEAWLPGTAPVRRGWGCRADLHLLPLADQL